MATAGLGDRDGFGVRLGPRGSAVVVFQMRGGRVVDRVELWSEGVPVAGGVDGMRSVAGVARGRGRRRGAVAVLRRPRAAARGPRAGAARGRRGHRGLAVVAGGAPGADRRPAPRRQAQPAGAGDAQRPGGLRVAEPGDAGRRRRRARGAAPRAAAAGHAAAHRLLRHLDVPGQRDGGLDGGLRGRPDAAARVPQVPDPAGRGRPAARGRHRPGARRGAARRTRPRPPGSSTTSSRCARSCAGAIERSSSAAGRCRT